MGVGAGAERRQDLGDQLVFGRAAPLWGHREPDRLELEVRQAAAELDIPEGTVKSRLHHARRELRRQCPDAGAKARTGAVVFPHRFGASLNAHYHFHACVIEGLYAVGVDRVELLNVLKHLAKLRSHRLQFVLGKTEPSKHSDFFDLFAGKSHGYVDVE